MVDIKKFNDFILEKSIGSEEIRIKWYPEIQGLKSPFDIVGGKERWQKVLSTICRKYEKLSDHYEKIKETMSLISDDAKKYIEEYYKKHGAN